MEITIVCGGPSTEHDISLKSSACILTALRHSRYKLSILFITKEGLSTFFVPKTTIQDHIQHIKSTQLVSLDKSLEVMKSSHQTALLAGIHGEFAEDGQIQRLLDSYSIPYTGSSAESSALCIDKFATNRHVSSVVGVSIPQTLLIQPHTTIASKDIPFDYPVIIKPNKLGSSIGMAVCTTFDKTYNAILTLQREFPYEQLLISEYVQGGIEVSCGCLQNKDQTQLLLPPIEIIPKKGSYFNYDSKYALNGSVEIVPPVSISQETSHFISQLACLIHKRLSCSTYSRCDFIIKNGQIYFLEINTLPGFTKTSLFPQETAAIGMSLQDTLEYIIENS